MTYFKKKYLRRLKNILDKKRKENYFSWQPKKVEKKPLVEVDDTLDEDVSSSSL